MTVIAAIKDHDGIVYAASDSLITDGNNRICNTAKFFRSSDLRHTVFDAGWHRTYNLLKVRGDNLFTNEGDYETRCHIFVQNVTAALANAGYDSNNSIATLRQAKTGDTNLITPPQLDLQFLYIADGNIFDIDESLAFTSVESGTPVAIGCGASLARGAMLGALASGKDAATAILIGMKTAIQIDIRCGYPIDFFIIRPKEYSKKKLASKIVTLMKKYSDKNIRMNY